MRIREADPGDATVLGEVMVESWLSAHRGQMPEAAWQQRVEEWTPDVSAAGWRRTLDEQGPHHARDDVLLVAEDPAGTVRGLVYGRFAADDASRGVAEIAAIYVATDHHRGGTGSALLAAAARDLQLLGAATLRVTVLTANLPARRFYEATGAVEVGSTTFDEEGHLLPCTVYEWSDVGALADS